VVIPNTTALIGRLVEIIRERYRNCFGDYSEYNGKCVSLLEKDDHDCEVCIEVSKRRTEAVLGKKLIKLVRRLYGGKD